MIKTFALLFSFVATSALASDVVFNLETGQSGQSIFVASQLTHWDQTAMKLNEVSPGHYRLSISPPWTNSFQYKFVVNGKWITDPNNSNLIDDGEGGKNSVMPVEFPEDPLLTLQAGVPPWMRSQFTVQDGTGANREIIVMSPPQHLRKHRREVTIVFNDGTSYLQEANAAVLLANLSSQPGMPLLTGIFTDPRDRMKEYANDDGYVSFLADTVMPAYEARYGASRLATDHLIIGSSLGGLISAYTGLKRPDVFANVASESGSFWWDHESLLPLLGKASLEQRFYFDVGQYEDPIMLTSNHDARDVAQKRGLHLLYQEFPSFHEFVGWRNRLSLIFRYFFQEN